MAGMKNESETEDGNYNGNINRVSG